MVYIIKVPYHKHVHHPVRFHFVYGQQQTGASTISASSPKIFFKIVGLQTFSHCGWQQHVDS